MSARYPQLPPDLQQQLLLVPPSQDGSLLYRPCFVTLKDGREIDGVYIVPETAYKKMWGIWPEEDKGKRWLNILDIAAIRESPSRLPPQFANEVYSVGESGMGYCIFTVQFRDGSSSVYITG